jgi:hypothetical protein
MKQFKRAATLDRRKVRQAFEKRFTARRMAQDYLHYYQHLVGASPAGDRTNIKSNPSEITLDAEAATLLNRAN